MCHNSQPLLVIRHWCIVSCSCIWGSWFVEIIFMCLFWCTLGKYLNSFLLLMFCCCCWMWMSHWVKCNFWHFNTWLLLMGRTLLCLLLIVLSNIKCCGFWSESDLLRGPKMNFTIDWVLNIIRIIFTILTSVHTNSLYNLEYDHIQPETCLACDTFILVPISKSRNLYFCSPLFAREGRLFIYPVLLLHAVLRGFCHILILCMTAFKNLVFINQVDFLATNLCIQCDIIMDGKLCISPTLLMHG